MAISVQNYADILREDLLDLIEKHFANLALDNTVDVNLSTMKLLDNLCITLQALARKTSTIHISGN